MEVEERKWGEEEDEERGEGEKQEVRRTIGMGGKGSEERCNVTKRNKKG